jgi:hypothetical protein
MAVIDFPDIGGHTLFCDDIRQETSGKTTYVGSYGAIMFVHGPFPFVLPKFAFGITLFQRASNFVPGLNVRIYLPGDDENGPPSIQTEIREVDAGAAMQQATIHSDYLDKQPGSPPTFIALVANLIFAPLELKSPGSIKVRAIRGDDIIRLGALSIAAAPTNTPAAP